MRLAIINTSIRQENTTRFTAQACEQAARAYNWQVTMLDITAFGTLFTGEYLTPENTAGPQRVILQSLIDTDAILFVVPTYYKNMPSGLKNFFDIVRWPELYDHKLIAFMASNHKNQDYGAEQAFKTVRGILKFFDTVAVMVHDFPIVDPQAIDQSEIVRCLELLRRYGEMMGLKGNEGEPAS